VRAALALLLACASTACTFVGQGEGEVTSSMLTVPECWTGPFDLSPDFFASVPFRETQQIRVQRGSDIQEVSDGVAILVNDTPKIRESLLGQSIEVGLPPKLLNEIAPGAALPEAPEVSLALYLQFSCHNQNIVLYAMSGTIVFSSLFSGDPSEDEGSEKFTDATFDVVMADPRDANPMDLVVPPEKTSPLTGSFRFHFQRGQPGQPFP
jgi:hypothetical protein